MARSSHLEAQQGIGVASLALAGMPDWIKVER
jgi:hypothetical protein